MDDETEKRLAALISSIIKRYNLMEENLACLQEEVKCLRKDMKDAAILLRDKHPWRLEEIDSEVRKFAESKSDERASC